MLQCSEEMFAVAAVPGLGVVVTSHGSTSRAFREGRCRLQSSGAEEMRWQRGVHV